MLLTAGWSWLIVLYSLPVTGFLGTGATFEADANLVVQLVMAAALVAGAFLAKQKRYRAHGICQTTVLLLNLWMIGLVMWPTFRRQVNPTFPKALHRSYYAAPIAHAALGMAAEFLGLYIVLVAGTNVLPVWLRFRNWKLWMRAEFVLWLVVVISGIGTYYAWYIGPFR
ncbi:MAG: hypothetical protein DMG88_04840 [Acidobacteria bacterium]|nr:MAG: hypothetical protein DMG88_04840 [Acidobacteriota bacterium]